MVAQFVPHVPNIQLVAGGQHPVPKMGRVNIPADVHEAVDEKHPGKGEVVGAAHSALAERPRLFPRYAPVLEAEPRRVAAKAGVTPVQRGEVEEHVNAAPQEIRTGDDVDPVTDADVVRVKSA